MRIKRKPRRKAKVLMHGRLAGTLIEEEKNSRYRFVYLEDYEGPCISVTMPVAKHSFEYERFPPFFDGLLPEGVNLEALLRSKKIDRDDTFSQLIAVGGNTVGAVTVHKLN